MNCRTQSLVPKLQVHVPSLSPGSQASSRPRGYRRLVTTAARLRPAQPAAPDSVPG